MTSKQFFKEIVNCSSKSCVSSAHFFFHKNQHFKTNTYQSFDVILLCLLPRDFTEKNKLEPSPLFLSSVQGTGDEVVSPDIGKLYDFLTRKWKQKSTVCLQTEKWISILLYFFMSITNSSLPVFSGNMDYVFVSPFYEYDSQWFFL